MATPRKKAATTKKSAPRKKAAAKSSTKSLDDVAKEVLRGDWGSGQERRKKLADAGYDVEEVRQAVVKQLNKTS